MRRSRLPITTAPACFEQLAGLHLNLLSSDADEEPAYCLTEPTSTQQTALRSLRMTHLVDEKEVAARIHPRR